MKHLRDDYNRIQDPGVYREGPEGPEFPIFHQIGEDEPVFLLRAQDKAFPAMLLCYIGYQRAVGNEALASFIENQMPAVHAWRNTHPSKQADLPADAKPGFLTRDEQGVMHRALRRSAAKKDASHE